MARRITFDTKALVAAQLAQAYIEGRHLGSGVGNVGRPSKEAVFDAYLDFWAKLEAEHVD